MIRNPLLEVIPEQINVEIDGLSQSRGKVRVLLLYKPRGFVTTHRDEQGRPTVFSLLNSMIQDPAEPRTHWITVGRLDLATTGVLLITNSSRIASTLTDPLSEVPRIYIVTVRGLLTENSLKKIQTGVVDQGELLKPDEVTIRKASGKETHLIVRLSEGKNREIRRIFKSLGHEVTKLKRVAYGGLELADLKPGESREVTAAEFKAAFPGLPALADLLA